MRLLRLLLTPLCVVIVLLCVLLRLLPGLSTCLRSISLGVGMLPLALLLLFTSGDLGLRLLRLGFRAESKGLWLAGEAADGAEAHLHSLWLRARRLDGIPQDLDCGGSGLNSLLRQTGKLLYVEALDVVGLVAICLSTLVVHKQSLALGIVIGDGIGRDSVAFTVVFQERLALQNLRHGDLLDLGQREE